MPNEPLPASELQPPVTAVPTDTALHESDFPADATQWPATLRYGVGLVLIAICVLGLLLVLPLLQIILISFLIAFIMFLPSRAMSRRFHLPYGLSVIISFLIAAGIVAALIVLLLPDVISVLESLRNALHQGIVQLLAELQNPAATIEVAGQTIDTETLNLALRQLLQAVDAANLGSSLAHVLFGFFGSLATMAAAIGTASVVALFFLIGLPISGGTMTSWIPKPYQREIVLLFGKLDTVWLKFFRAFIIIGVITGAASLGLFWLFGIAGAFLLAVVTATIGLIPYLGRLFAIILIGIVTLLNGSTRFTGLDNLTFTILTIIAYSVVTQAIGVIVAPQLKGSALNVPVVAIVIGVMVGFTVAGIVGAILVAPIMGSVRVFMQFSIAKILLRDPYPGEEVLPLLEEGFFSHMLYVKKKPEPEAEAK